MVDKNKSKNPVHDARGVLNKIVISLELAELSLERLDQKNLSHLLQEIRFGCREMAQIFDDLER